LPVSPNCKLDDVTGKDSRRDLVRSIGLCNRGAIPFGYTLSTSTARGQQTRKRESEQTLINMLMHT